MYFWYCISAIAAGTLIPLQAGLNAALRGYLGNPYYATLVSVVLSTVAIALFILIGRQPLPTVQVALQAPWWVWMGGIVGVIYLCAVLMLAPKLGATTLIASIIAGQLLCSLILDQFGLAGFTQHSVNAGRILGIVLLFAGVLLIQRN
jgi:transporter family-2 protein